MRGSIRLLRFALWGAVLLTVGTAMAAEASPPVRLRIPFVTALTEDHTTLDPAYSHGHCAISGEQALRIERDTSDPCLAAEASPGGACFDRLGLDALRAQRAPLPHDGSKRCVN
jgi:hypothetical protein